MCSQALILSITWLWVTPASALAGQSISFLLATQVGKICAVLGAGPQVIAAARSLAAAEQNLILFVISVPSICDVDPAVRGSDADNANSAKFLHSPFDTTGLSVGEVMAAQRFTNFTTQAAGGTFRAALTTGNEDGAADIPVASTAAAPSSAASACAPSTAFVTVTRAGLDFGACTPTIKFEAGLKDHKETELTFQAIDPALNPAQQEALNLNIITIHICDQPGNICAANAAAKKTYTSAKAVISALETRDQATADKWTELLDFASTNTNLDQASKTGHVSHT
ncbi:hypothetical protein JHW43_005192 [Diplocarpon mali]|nr:hypothetical protein JHW43_005192 [Diplocarpon mali]